MSVSMQMWRHFERHLLPFSREFSACDMGGGTPWFLPVWIAGWLGGGSLGYFSTLFGECQAPYASSYFVERFPLTCPRNGFIIFCNPLHAFLFQILGVMEVVYDERCCEICRCFSCYRFTGHQWER